MCSSDLIDATFTATGGSFDYKTIAGYTGVGVSGKTTGEIDIGESIVGVFTGAVYVPYISLAFLFDGPEFGEVQEKASISVVLKSGETVAYTLTALFQADYEWTGASKIVENMSLPTRTKAGVWEIEDPFDGMEVTQITFTALRGECGRGVCDNQSDFAFESLGIQQLAEIPEPGTMALLLSGVAMLGAVARRRMASTGR